MRHQFMQVSGSGLMKFTRDWLFDHLETDGHIAILEALPMLGLEVESVVDRKILALFVIAGSVSCSIQMPTNAAVQGQYWY